MARYVDYFKAQHAYYFNENGQITDTEDKATVAGFHSLFAHDISKDPKVLDHVVALIVGSH